MHCIIHIDIEFFLLGGNEQWTPQCHIIDPGWSNHRNILQRTRIT